MFLPWGPWEALTLFFDERNSVYWHALGKSFQNEIEVTSFFQNVSNTQERQQEPSSWPLASFSKAVKKLSLTRQAKFHPTCSPLCAILRQHKGTWNCRMLRQSAGKGMRFCGTGSTSYCQPHNVRDKWDLNNWIQLNRWFKTRLLHIAFIGNFDHVQSSRIRLETSVKQRPSSHDVKCWKFRHLGTQFATPPEPEARSLPQRQRETTWLIDSYDQLKVRISHLFANSLHIGLFAHRRTSEFQAAGGLQQLASPAQELLPLPCCRSLPCGLQLRKGTGFIHHEMLLNCDFVKYKNL